MESTEEAWDNYESEDEDANGVITAAMRRAAEAERIMIEKHVAAAQRAEATRRAALEKRAEVERRRALRQQIAVELEAVAAKRDGLRHDKDIHRARLRLVVGELQAKAQRRVAAASVRPQEEMAAECRRVMTELVTAPATAEGNGAPVYTPFLSRNWNANAGWSVPWWDRKRKQHQVDVIDYRSKIPTRPLQ